MFDLAVKEAMTSKVSNRKDAQPKSRRGGARPGSGPKPDEPKVRRSVGLSARQWAIFDEAGGNDWLRLALDSMGSKGPDGT